MEIFKLPSGRPLSYEFTYKTEPDRPTILLSNSLCAQYGFWDRVVSVLHDEGFRVILYDHPGHGQSGVSSDLSSTTFDSLADDVYTLLRSPDITQWFAGVNSPSTLTPSLHAWIGVSMGAALGVVFAVRHPGMIRNLLICDTIACSPSNAGEPDAFGPRVAAARTAGTMAKTVDETMERWFGAEWTAANADEATRVRKLMQTTSADGFETCIAALKSDTFDIRPLVGRLAECVEHVKLVVGERDADLPVKMAQMRDQVQKGFDAAGKNEKVELVIIPKAGHVPFIDGYEDYIRAILPFLKH
ncbi:alpha/beta-hydrolase [Coniochaeta ligniaria NRRL 30616]|uniref:Alpha/beta-hydrolase n=1 Tax=Coniochaeta ligniaria NRRL 30616 TaxID=1408157 RepID=A0A1J7I5X0_9PEZI|nr:alpha/beta-hydrolase [Coniochaeta ligniaria NRRL 30616]